MARNGPGIDTPTPAIAQGQARTQAGFETRHHRVIGSKRVCGVVVLSARNALLLGISDEFELLGIQTSSVRPRDSSAARFGTVRLTQV